ncbi:MAG: hypothetical protein N3B01_03925 [Verrucomicrobiae bacterium]|nr:hypothetical protein [Verrucomicrobiae bacterium]
MRYFWRRMKKLKLPPGVREDFELLLAEGAARWPQFEKRFAAALANAWSRLSQAQKTILLNSWAQWEKRRKPQAWVKFVETLAPEISDPKVWGFYQPDGGIFNIVVPPCLAMPENVLNVFVARELHRAVVVAEGTGAENPPLMDGEVSARLRQAGYDEELLLRWVAEHGGSA